MPILKVKIIPKMNLKKQTTDTLLLISRQHILLYYVQILFMMFCQFGKINPYFDLDVFVFIYFM